jgi:hypothetical protein
MKKAVVAQHLSEGAEGNHVIPIKETYMPLSPQVNYTDCATATCWQNLVPTFADRGVSRGQRG